MNPLDLGTILFALLVWRDLQEGRLDADGCLRAGCLLARVAGGAVLLIGLLAGR
jgi:hypothetical protein